MATPNNNPNDPVHRVATLLSTAVHRTYDDWPQVEESGQLRSLVIEAGAVLRYLVGGNPPEAAKHLDYFDQNYVQIPNGDRP